MWRRSRETELCSYYGSIRSSNNEAGNCVGPSRIDANRLQSELNPSLIFETLQESESLKTYLAIRGLGDGEIARSIARSKSAARHQALLEAVSVFDEDIMDQANRLHIYTHATETTSEWMLRVRRGAIEALLEVEIDRPSASEIK